MQKLKIFIGVSALCLLFSFNLRHALNDYGVSDPNNELHPQVLAQTNTAGNGGGSTPGNGDISNPGGGTPVWRDYWFTTHRTPREWTRLTHTIENFMGQVICRFQTIDVAIGCSPGGTYPECELGVITVRTVIQGNCPE